MKWWHVVGVLLLVGVGFGVYSIISAPIPGQKKDDQGREHVAPAAVAQFSYGSNPPTSGPHLPTWVKAGVFDAQQSEGELIHSLEHGYVIVSYNCNVHLKETSWFIENVYAHEEGSPSADFVDPTISTVSAINDTQGCKELVKNLEDVAKKNRLWKLIVVPRPQLDTTIALTAWNYIDKFDQFDEQRIRKFIDYHRDQGPEKTME